MQGKPRASPQTLYAHSDGEADYDAGDEDFVPSSDEMDEDDGPVDELERALQQCTRRLEHLRHSTVLPVGKRSDEGDDEEDTVWGEQSDDDLSLHPSGRRPSQVSRSDRDDDDIVDSDPGPSYDQRRVGGLGNRISMLRELRTQA